jgi:hypothetical protein
MEPKPAFMLNCHQMWPTPFRSNQLSFGAMLFIRGDYFRFGSVFIKKVTKSKFFLKKKPKPNRNQVKPTGFGSVRFFREKTGSNRFGSVFFSGFLSVSVRFFWFFVYKTETEPNRLVFSKI